MNRSFLACACLFALAFISAAQRSPGNTVRENYKLRLAPDLGKANFVGDEIIRVRVLSPVPGRVCVRQIIS